eukprot:GHRR01005310.1.p1 GENE.GHRR01005310.1~~GHRR01005310.1.p1  ORF type:complete len:205 (+),score=52.55 GHRR01005310.1:218-832(+)
MALNMRTCTCSSQLAAKRSQLRWPVTSQLRASQAQNRHGNMTHKVMADSAQNASSSSATPDSPSRQQQQDVSVLHRIFLLGSQDSVPVMNLLAVAWLLLLAIPAGPAAADSLQQHGPHALYDLAEGEEFWGNVAKYGRYFVTVLLGTGYVMVQPVVAAFKRPVTAVVAIVALVGGSILLKLTLDAMLGIQEPFAYEPGNVAPYN